jgi:Arc/MetJ-type ribon-helix-helix transcriptional regulator
MTQRTTVAKVTVSIPPDLMGFLERYQKSHALESRSEVIARGLRQLQAAELAHAYQAHALEWAKDPDAEFWDTAALDDGIEAEKKT